jgi:hypothetical protein
MISGRLGFMGPTFNPKSISGLKVWLDVSNYASLTFNGSAVSQINDLSGNGFHATQSTGSLQPLYQATGFNGRPCVAFNGSQTQKLVTGATIANYINTPTTNPQFTLIASWYQATTANAGAIAWGSDLQSNGRVFFNTFYGGATMYFDVANASGGRMSATLTQSNYTSPIIHTAYRHGANMAVRRNGAVDANKTTASGNFATTTAKLSLGSGDGTGGASYLSELLVYSAALSASDITAVERYLGAKWGVTVA